MLYGTNQDGSIIFLQFFHTVYTPPAAKIWGDPGVPLQIQTAADSAGYTDPLLRLRSEEFQDFPSSVPLWMP